METVFQDKYEEDRPLDVINSREQESEKSDIRSCDRHISSLFAGDIDQNLLPCVKKTLPHRSDLQI